MMRQYLKLTKQEWHNFKWRNLELIFDLLNSNEALKEKYLQRWRLLKYRFNRKNIILFEKIKLFFYKKVCVPTMDFNITTRCTLKCKDCGSLMPLYTKEQHFDEEFESFKERLDALLKNVNYIYQCKLIGGEPLLNKYLADMVDYACAKKQILLVEVVTNGTIIPSKRVLESFVCNKHKLNVFVSNYTLNVKGIKYNEVLNILDKNNIPYSTTQTQDFKWVQRGDIFPRI